MLISGAGVLHLGIAEERPVDGDRSVVETNFFGVVRVTNAEFSDIRARRQRRIINVGSLAAWVGEPGEAFDPASSYALAGYTRALRHEVWREESTSHRWNPAFSKPVLWTLPQLLQVPSQVVMSCVRLRITCSMKVFGSVAIRTTWRALPSRLPARVRHAFAAVWAASHLGCCASKSFCHRVFSTRSCEMFTPS